MNGINHTFSEHSHPAQYAALIILMIMVIITGKGCMMRYHPATAWEAREFDRSNFKIQPSQVRSDPEKFTHLQVAWIGIIKESEFYENPENYRIILLMDHRFFDWRINRWDSPEMLYPSMMGEGLFQTNWYLRKGADLDYFMDRFTPGNLAIVYARPDTVINEIVLVNAAYIRVIDHEYIRTDVSEYTP